MNVNMCVPLVCVFDYSLNDGLILRASVSYASLQAKLGQKTRLRKGNQRGGSGYLIFVNHEWRVYVVVNVDTSFFPKADAN